MSSDQEFEKWGFPGSPVDRGQVWVMKRAQDIAAAEGTDIKFVTAIWSPPVWMKNAGDKTYNGSVPTANYQQFADYAADLVQGYEKKYGIPLYSLSISNEPDHTGSYSSSTWTAATYAAVLKYVGDEFARRGIKTKLHGVEPMSFGLGLFQNTMRTPDSWKYLDDLGFHTYTWNNRAGSDPSTIGEAKARAQQDGRGIWNTEVSIMNSQISGGITKFPANDGRMAATWASFWGRQLDMTEMNATGQWWAWGYKKLNQASAGTTGTVSFEDLIYLPNSTSNAVVDGERGGGGSFDGTYEVSRALYALGHYSKFVRPGWKRVNHTQPDFVPGNATENNASDPTDLISSSFINPEANPDGTHDIAVVVANGGTSHTLNLSFPGYTVTDGKQYLTDSTVNLVDDAPTNVTFNNGGATPLTIAANSVYTFTGKAKKVDSYRINAGSIIPAANYHQVMGAYTNKGVGMQDAYLQTYDIPGPTTATSGNTLATIRYNGLDFGQGMNVLRLSTSNASSDGDVPIKVYVDSVTPANLISAPDATFVASTSTTPTTRQVSLTGVVKGQHDVILEIGADASNRTVRLQNLSFASVTDAYQLTVTTAGEGSVSGGSAGRYLVGETVTLTAAASGDTAFVGWNSADLGYIGARAATNPTTISFSMPASNVTIEASFRKPSDSISEAYSDYFKIGNIWRNNSTYTEPNWAPLLAKHFNAMSPENALKPSSLLTSVNAAGTFTWNNNGLTSGDNFVNESRAQGKAVHGHVLVWHDQSPTSINSGSGGGTRALARRNMEGYIKYVTQYFQNRIDTWDVVNEAFDNEIATFDPATQDWRDYLRGGPKAPGSTSRWYTAYQNGATADDDRADFLYDAFYWARKYAPESTLYYNDFNLFQSGKLDMVLAMAKWVNDRWFAENPDETRPLVEGIGMQSHNYIAQTPAFAPAGDTAFADLVDAGAPASIDSVESGIQKIIAAGFTMSASELDLFVFETYNGMPQGGSETSNAGYKDLVDPTAKDLFSRAGFTYWVGKITNRAELERLQADRYAQYFAVYKKYSNHIDHITFWGLSDYQSWRPNHNGLLYNRDFSEKLSVPAIYNPEGWLGLDYVITDKSDLVAGIDAAEAAATGTYTASTYGAYRAALTRAKEANASAKATQGEVRLATTELANATALLAPLGDPGPLKELVDLLNGLNLRQEQFAAGWEAFDRDYQAGVALLADPSDALTSDIVAAVAAIQESFWNLVPVADQTLPEVTAAKAILEIVLTAGKGLDPAVYTDASWAAYAAARAAAVNVMDDPKADLAQVQAASTALSAAMVGLAEKPPVVVSPAVAVKAAQSSVRLVQGTSIAIPAYGYTATGTLAAVNWSSSKPAVATVSDSGEIRAIKAGKATITVKAANGKKATIAVTVIKKKPAKSPKVKKITLSGVSTKASVGKVSYLKVKYSPSTVVAAKVTFKSSKDSVVTVDEAGRVTAVAKGKATVTVKVGSKTKKVTITVK